MEELIGLDLVSTVVLYLFIGVFMSKFLYECYIYMSSYTRDVVETCWDFGDSLVIVFLTILWPLTAPLAFISVIFYKVFMS